MNALPFLSPAERRYFSQVQGRTYANMFGLVERFINAKVLELSRDHWFGDQTALEALIRFSDEELKHQALFRRVEALISEAMPAGYSFSWNPNGVAAVVLGKSSWAVLALTLHIELFTQAHYRESIRQDAELSELARDVFRFHWREECQHAIMDELEWRRVDAAATPEARDQAVDELIELVGAVDSIVTDQASSDSRYFIETCGRQFDATAADGRAAHDAGGLSAAIHPVRRPAPPLCRRTRQHDHRRTARADPCRALRAGADANAECGLNHTSHT